MSDFVNYNKRSINLPPGCKDLIDIVRPMKARSKHSRDVAMFSGETGTLSAVSRHTKKFLKGGQGLLIHTTDEKLGFALTRLMRGTITASVDFPEDAAREAQVKAMFTRYGLDVPRATEMPAQFVPEVAVWTRFPIKPFPSDTPRLVEIATAVFRELCHVTGETPLHFRHFAME